MDYRQYIQHMDEESTMANEDFLLEYGKTYNVLSSIKKEARSVLPEGGNVLLYGSRARGDANASSDWDLLVIVDKEELLPEDYDSITYPLTKLGWLLGEDINPIMYTRKEWKQNSFTTFYHNVEKDAIQLV